MRNIILCGFMGSGKTVTGKKLAEMLDMKFVDLDRFIEAEQNLKISQIFETFGEEYFRELETKAAKGLGKAEGTVIALGGGTVLKEENVIALKVNGDIYYLSVEANTVMKRLETDTTRPLLKKNKNNAILSLLNERLPKYKAAADYIVDSNGSIEQTVESIIEIVRRKNV